MRAAIFRGGDIVVDTLPEPVPAIGQVLVKTLACGICGSDLHMYDGSHPVLRPPLVMGHEFAGVVAEVGEGVTNVTEGDRVVVEPYDVCGECAACTAGRYNICRKLGFVGLDGQQGGFAEKCVVGSRWVHRLGDIPTDLGALVEPLVYCRITRRSGSGGGTSSASPPGTPGAPGSTLPSGAIGGSPGWGV